MRDDPERFVTFILGTFAFVFYGGLGWLTIRVWRRTGRCPWLVFTNGSPRELMKGVMALAWPVLVLAWSFSPRAFRWLPHAAALETWAGRLLGLLLLCLGTSMAAVAYGELGDRWTVGIDPRSEGLVTSGIYASARHPVYGAFFLCFAGIFLLAPNAMFAMLFVSTWIVFRRQAGLEERFLASRYGSTYEEYAGRTGRFFPRAAKQRDSNAQR